MARKIFLFITMMFIVTISLRSYGDGLNIVEADGQVEQYYIDEVNRQLDFVPDEMLYDFVLSGWRFFVTDKDIDSYYCDGYWGSVLGCNINDEKIILIEDRELAVKEAPIHELGHWFDRINGYPSRTDEFYNIYAEETSSFYAAFDYYSYYDQGEMFAESLWRYFCFGDELEENCPKLYQFIDNLLKSKYQFEEEKAADCSR